MRAELAVPGLQVVDEQALQRAVHDPRHDHDAAVRDADGRGVRELPRAAPGRRGGHGVPAAQRAVVLAVPVRRADRPVGVPASRAARRTSAGPATRRTPTLPYSTTTGTDLWIVGLLLTGVASILGRGQLRGHDLHPAGARDVDAPDADLHLDDPRDVDPDPVRVPGAHRGAGDAPARPAVRGRRSSTRPQGGDPILWQHLFWFFGHPEVYIIVLPFFGVIGRRSIPVFSRKPLFGYRAFVLATVFIGVYSMTVWAHHMFTTGRGEPAVLRRDLVHHRGPDRDQVLQLDRHDDRRGRLTFPTPMLWSRRVPVHCSCSAGSPASSSPRRRSTSTSRTRTSSSPTSTTCWSAGRSSRCWRGSTSGSRR